MYNHRSLHSVAQTELLAGWLNYMVDAAGDALEIWSETGHPGALAAFIQSDQMVMSLLDELSHRVYIKTGIDFGQDQRRRMEE